MSDRKVVDTLRVGPNDMAAIMAELDSAQSSVPTHSARFLKRWKFRGVVAVLSLIDEMGNRANFAVAPRDLSASGIGLLHGSFVHQKQRCQIGLRRLDGSVATINGVVRRCRHVHGRLHEIGIEFDERVSPTDFIAFDNEQVFQVERVELDKLSGTALIVTESIDEQRLFSHYFKGSGLELLFARDVDSAHGMLDENPTLIFIDAGLSDDSANGEAGGDAGGKSPEGVLQCPGLRLVQQLRDKGIAQPIILLTAEVGGVFREAAIKAGADEILVKPCPPELLHQAAAEYLESSALCESVSSLHFVVSSAKETGLDLELIQSYATGLREHARSMQSALDAGDRAALRSAALKIKGSAASFGFGPVGRAADEVLRVVTYNHDRQIAEAVSRLCELCERVRAVA
jgi:CheY-like chemotaxis protein